jgi:hypothetical protein
MVVDWMTGRGGCREHTVASCKEEDMGDGIGILIFKQVVCSADHAFVPLYCIAKKM